MVVHAMVILAVIYFGHLKKLLCNVMYWLTTGLMRNVWFPTVYELCQVAAPI